MIMGFGMPLIAVQVTTGYFLEGINRVRPGMIIILIVNVANIYLNDILINGRMGFLQWEPRARHGQPILYA